VRTIVAHINAQIQQTW